MNNNTENNILIAEFMGYTKGHPNKSETRWKDGWFCPQGVRVTDKQNPMLLFSSSWDWLMPVVEKIEKLDVTDEFNIRYDSVFEPHHFCEFISSTKDFPNFRVEAESKMEAVLLCVVDIIKQYNLT